MKLPISQCILLLTALDAHFAQAGALGGEADPALLKLNKRQYKVPDNLNPAGHTVSVVANVIYE
ncbi:hypothetical protein B0T21DRAFT_409668 [Apiosordaria backusii]|uniref:Uncharacterized protein n=1 Tax=Apiosordaria backusii TaxID=314023 RepID=A0AA40BRY9_9PEZI|nr:hypothetical protein B0T21DRAFT_409668 [Apiosordaria backusii]